MTSALPKTAAAALALLLMGCPPVLVEFAPADDDDSVPPDDDDDATTDDDDTAPEIAPTLVTASVVDLPPLVGEVEVSFTVSDPDSDEVSVGIRFAAGADEPFGTATTSGETTIFGGPPLDDAGLFRWDTAADLPHAVSGARLQLCPVDAEGNEGACFELTDMLVYNTPSTWEGAFCEPGTVEGMDWLGGQALVPLSDWECLNAQITEPPLETDFTSRFGVVLVNPNAAPVGFTISPGESGSPNESSAPFPTPASGSSVGETGGGGPCEYDLNMADVHNDTRTFYLREAILPGAARTTRGATLRALGDHVAVYVDDETAIDLDYDCSDPLNSVVPDSLPAFGFDSCDLQQVVDVFDVNVYPTVTGLYGSPSDVDNNCRVTVLLSHRVNALPLTDSDPDNDAFALKSFSEPEIDLWESNLLNNPDSNEEEMLYLFAPDPIGLWSNEEVPVEDYLDFNLAGQLAIALQDLVSYGTHVGVTDALLAPGAPAGDEEDDWLNDAMGLLAADLVGFGAVAYQDAWLYLDRSHLQPLTAANTLADFQDRGGQYLFARYLHDLYGDAMIATILSSTTTGAASVELVTGVPFVEFVADWALAMAVSGQTTDAGGPLVADSVLAKFHEPSFLTVPEVPAPGDPLGANGFQQGFSVRGVNLTFTDGISADGPVEVERLRVVADNLDSHVYHPQAEFNGVIDGGFGTMLILVDGLSQEVNSLLIETADGSDLVGRVVRLGDAHPSIPDLTLEEVDGAVLTTVRPLNVTFLDVQPLNSGRERRVIGRIDPVSFIQTAESFDPELPAPSGPTMVVAELPDTDRYSLTLLAAAQVGIQVERRYSDVAGGVELEDPFVAIVLASDLPDPWNYPEWDFGPAAGACADPTWFDYPSVVPDWVHAQGVLASDPTAAADSAPVVDWLAPEDTVWAGDPASCTYDHDADGVPDYFEALPMTLADQIRQRQAQNLAADPEFYADPWSFLPDSPVDPSAPFFGADFIDLDSNESPDDSFATSLPALALGGRAARGGEEAVWTGTLPPGDYIIVVGGTNGSTGPYDLSVRLID
ncbi:MAG: hypothetical protein GY898_13655 [Proteobacteria bacterium]|nr:hypothetical protein [Pseudomonadota bacterium]